MSNTSILSALVQRFACSITSNTGTNGHRDAVARTTRRAV